MINDRFTVKKIKEGDIKAFEDIFRQYYLPLYYYYFSLSIIQKQDVAEEIVQDLFYYWWKERENIQIHYSIKNYLYKTVQNKSFQHIEHCNVREKYRQYTLSSIQTEQDTPPKKSWNKKNCKIY